MKPIFILALLIFGYAYAGEFNCSPNQVVKWEQLSEGVEWTKFDLAYTPYNKDEHHWNSTLSRSVTVRAFKMNLKSNKLLFHSPDKDLDCTLPSDRYIQKMIQDYGGNIIGAINASFFALPGRSILGMALDEKKIWSDDLSTQTISSSGVFAIEKGIPSLVTRDEFIQRFGTILTQEVATDFSFAVQAYPKLLINEALQISDSVLNTRRSRTSIGINENPQEIILLTIDARGETDKTGMTLYEFAHLVKTSQCGVKQKTVLNLDGGGSSSFAIPSLKIYEQADRCRHLGNILTIQKKL